MSLPVRGSTSGVIACNHNSVVSGGSEERFHVERWRRLVVGLVIGDQRGYPGSPQRISTTLSFLLLFNANYCSETLYFSMRYWLAKKGYWWVSFPPLF